MNKCNICGKKFNTEKSLKFHKMSHKRYVKQKINIKKICSKCGEGFTVERTVNKNGTYNIRKKERKFCSSRCANSRIQTKEMNETRRLKLTKNIVFSCKVRGKVLKLKNKFGYCQEHYFKSKEFREIHRTSCDKQNGKSKGNRVKRSKNEVLFYDMCNEYFNNVKRNKPMFNGWDADVIIEDIKTAVLWNGKWHYETIMERHNLKQVQNRDKLKLKEIEKCGYKAYIIKDMGRHNPEFVKEQFKIFIER